jgi:peptide/nickel transport system substrate-binding protein
MCNALSSRAKVKARARAETSREPALSELRARARGSRTGTLCLPLTSSKIFQVIACAVCLALASCASKPDPNALVMIIESSPTNLDPRVGLDAQSERIDDLIFDDLLTRGANLDVAPGLAERWDIPDPLTYVFHLHHGVKFHDGRPLTARDVKWTFDSLLQGKIRSAKASVYQFVDRIDATDDFTVVFHLKEPFATLLWNLSDGAMGIVPYGSGDEISRQPIGSGPFRFISAEPDKEVVLALNNEYWGEKAHLQNVRFIVVPDTTTRALELRKGSADIAINALTSDMVLSLEHDPNLAIMHAPGTVLAYLAFNLRDPVLKDERVRQAVAYAVDRRPFLEYLLRGFARPANSVLPPESWAYNGDVPAYNHDPARARQLLEQAGYPEVNGVRFHLTMKSSTEESTRLMAAVLQQQLRQVGIALDIRTFEFATFFSDVTHGLFQLYSLRWIGGNEDPDIFEYIFHSSKFPPNGANRGYFADPRIDALVDQARRELDQNTRKQLYAEIQRTLADQLPYVNLWYFDNVLVYSKRVRSLTLNSSGNYDFLKTAELEVRR